MEQSLEKVKKEAQRLLSKTKESHGWDHTERVYNLCLHLGRSEKANLQILQLAALLHDIGRSKEDKLKGQVCHAQEGAVLAAKILKKLGY